MKKNKTIEQLAKFLYECAEENTMNYKETSKAILEFLESKGMVPASYRSYEGDDIMGDPRFVVKHGWEPDKCEYCTVPCGYEWCPTNDKTKPEDTNFGGC